MTTTAYLRVVVLTQLAEAADLATGAGLRLEEARGLDAGQLAEARGWSKAGRKLACVAGARKSPLPVGQGAPGGAHRSLS